MRRSLPRSWRAAPKLMPLVTLLLFVSSTGGHAAPVRRLVLFGGGERPPEAMARFVAWAGGGTARLLVVPWASDEPKESCEAIVADLHAQGAGEVACAPGMPLDAGKTADVRTALRRATGVFFTGGDQARIMDVLADTTLLAAMRSGYEAGVAFAGTSAGTAVMSLLMITGKGDFTVIDGKQVGVRPGLGLLRGVIVDQHFVKRQRENRLFGLVLDHPSQRGVGIDEGTALLVTDGHEAEVQGPGLVVLVDAAGRDQLEVRLLRSGRRFDLRRK